MKLDKVTRNKITRDALISIFLFALPVLLMLLSFKISGQRPWQQQTATTKVSR
ncbi:hypothetical protein [Chitinophaga pinensis]|uniref:hypothetical protein n=1 Tax=Chitinophaga pinensis TaxID=79329 RepID=UPI001645532C|nr:hypothetical protein [Chitinophaga pinensis]